MAENKHKHKEEPEISEPVFTNHELDMDVEKHSYEDPNQKTDTANGDELSPPPDGGLLAWSQVAVGFVNFFNSWGVVNAFGAYQNYYQSHFLSNESPSNISWIGSIQAFMVMLGSVLLGRLLDAGYLRPILISGTFLLPFGLMMTSISTEFYQVFLAQGICAGLGCSCFFASGISTVAPYFKKHRATALGIIASGSSMGGIVYPVMVQQLIPKVGFPWATRIIAFMVFGLSLLPTLVLRSRVPPRKSGPLVDIDTLKDKAFMMFTAGTVLSFIGLYVPIFYIEAWAKDNNVKPVIADNIVSILSAGSVFGRLIPNFLADRFTGPLNMLIPCVAAAGLLVFCWIAVAGDAGTVAFAVLYGYASGSLVSLPGSVVSTMTTDMSKLGSRLGINFSFTALGLLCGSPVAGAIINATGTYLYAQIFAGCATILASVCLAISRYMSVGTGMHKI